MIKNVGILFFTENGEATSNEIETFFKDVWNIDTFDKTKGKAAEYVAENFSKRDVIIFIGAAGIATRLIAKHIKRKDEDPAVIVIDELKKYVIPILSGHIGGGNELANEIAVKLGSEAVITTATDINGCFAADVWATNLGCIVPNIGEIKHISSAVLRGEKISLACEGFEVSGKLPDCFSKDSAKTTCGIDVSLHGKSKRFKNTLNIIPKIVNLGVGCRRDTDSAKFEKYILKTLEEKGISLKAIKSISSIDLKKDERCIIDFASKYDIPFDVYDASSLNKVEGDFTSSSFVKSITGVDNVCERSACVTGGSLLFRKKSESGMTVSAAKTDWKCKF